MPFSAPKFASRRPIRLYGITFALMTPHMPYGAPHASWCPICLYGATSAFRRPICLLQAPSNPMISIWCAHFNTNDKRSGQKIPVSSSLPSHHIFFLFNTHNYVRLPKGILVFHSQGEFVMVSVAMTSSISISSTNWLTWLNLGFDISNLQSSPPF
jgi:hypothetical protein